MGVALALLGGTCANPCDLYEDRLNALIKDFEVPVTPAPPDDPDDGGVDLCYDLPDRYAYKYPYTKIPRGCGRIETPPEGLDLHWRDHFREKVPMPPIPPEEEAGLIYKRPPTDWAQKGTITLTNAIGKRTGNVVNELTDILDIEGQHDARRGDDPEQGQGRVRVPGTGWSSVPATR